jgi:plasmid replication initiation protein
MAIVNKDLIQSYIMTTAKYDFNVYEKRIIYRLVEMAQGEVQGVKFANNCQKIEHDLFSCVNITMPIACLLNGEEDKNYARVKEALQSLQRKIFEYEDDEIWQSISIIALPYIRKRSSVLSFQVHPRVWDCILDFSKGYRKYELKAAMSFKSQFSMRFYELLSNQKSPLTYSVIQLKEMFCVADKYERINDFIRYVVEAAKKELDEVSHIHLNTPPSNREERLPP